MSCHVAYRDPNLGCTVPVYAYFLESKAANRDTDGTFVTPLRYRYQDDAAFNNANCRWGRGRRRLYQRQNCTTFSGSQHCRAIQSMWREGERERGGRLVQKQRVSIYLSYKRRHISRWHNISDMSRPPRVYTESGQLDLFSLAV